MLDFDVRKWFTWFILPTPADIIFCYFRGGAGILRTVWSSEEVPASLCKLCVCLVVCLSVCRCVCRSARYLIPVGGLLFKDKETGFHRGFCWVGFTSEDALINALQKDPHTLEGAKVECQP